MAEENWGRFQFIGRHVYDFETAARPEWASPWERWFINAEDFQGMAEGVQFTARGWEACWNHREQDIMALKETITRLTTERTATIDQLHDENRQVRQENRQLRADKEKTYVQHAEAETEFHRTVRTMEAAHEAHIEKLLAENRNLLEALELEQGINRALLAEKEDLRAQLKTITDAFQEKLRSSAQSGMQAGSPMTLTAPQEAALTAMATPRPKPEEESYEALHARLKIFNEYKDPVLRIQLLQTHQREVRAARLEEQNRIQQQIEDLHRRLASDYEFKARTEREDYVKKLRKVLDRVAETLFEEERKGL